MWPFTALLPVNPKTFITTPYTIRCLCLIIPSPQQGETNMGKLPSAGTDKATDEPRAPAAPVANCGMGCTSMAQCRDTDQCSVSWPFTAPANGGQILTDESNTVPSIRDSCDYASFHEDLLRLSEPGLNRKQAKVIRSSIVNTIDARVRAFAYSGVCAAGSIADDPEFKKLASDLWASRQDSMLAAFNDLAHYVDSRMKGSK